MSTRVHSPTLGKQGIMTCCVDTAIVEYIYKTYKMKIKNGIYFSCEIYVFCFYFYTKEEKNYYEKLKE